MRAYDAAKLAALSAAGVKMYHGTHDTGEFLFVPQGWIVIEASACTELIFGYRKAFMQVSQAAVNQYKTAISLYKASARDVSRMDAILRVMEEHEEH